MTKNKTPAEEPATITKKKLHQAFEKVARTSSQMHLLYPDVIEAAEGAFKGVKKISRETLRKAMEKACMTPSGIDMANSRMAEKILANIPLSSEEKNAAAEQRSSNMEKEKNAYKKRQRRRNSKVGQLEERVAQLEHENRTLRMQLRTQRLKDFGSPGLTD